MIHIPLDIPYLSVSANVGQALSHWSQCGCRGAGCELRERDGERWRVGERDGELGRAMESWGEKREIREVHQSKGRSQVYCIKTTSLA